MVIRRRISRFLKEAIIWTVVVILSTGLEIQLARPVLAATAGQTILYFHKEPSDANETYNALLPNPDEAGADTASAATSTTNVNASPPTSFCESSNNTGETFNQVSAAAASTGNRCIGTFISPPVGQAFTMSTGDAASISIDLYSSESFANMTSIPTAYVYRWTGSGTTLAAADRVATFNGTDPGTAITLYASAAVSPANNISFAATDRIVVIISQNVTKGHVGDSVSNYFDSNARSPSSNLQMGYMLATPNTPALTGDNDDAFTQATATTSCTGSPGFNTLWTCNDNAAANTGGTFNDEDLVPTGSAGDSSGWLWLANACGSGTVACTPSNFGTVPSNTYMSQPLAPNYGDGNVRTVLSSSLAYTIGATSPATPFNHAGIVMWTSNTDYLEVQVYAAAVKGAANTAKVAINNSGTLATTANINSTLSNGLYNRIWVGFAKTGTSYQAQYSTDGSTWTNLGTAVTHSAFNTTGLNTFSAVGISTSVTKYAAGFNWFSSTMNAPPSPQQRMRNGKWWKNGAEQNYWLY